MQLSFIDLLFIFPRASVAVELGLFRLLFLVLSELRFPQVVEIGENAPEIRRAVVDRMSCFGIELSEAANAKNELRISSESSRVRCYVVPTDEELMIARHTLQVLRKHEMPEEKRA